MKTYYIHPAVNGHIRVSFRFKRGRKEFAYHSFTVDLPGHWHETKYNCHVDGYDYQFDTLDEALNCGAIVKRFNGEEFKFIHTDEPFIKEGQL